MSTPAHPHSSASTHPSTALRRVVGVSCISVLLSFACASEREAGSRATDLDLRAFGVAEVVPDDAGYLLLDRRGEEIGSVEIDVDDGAGSLRVSLADDVGELRWTENAGHAACEPSPSHSPSDPVACGAALAIANQVASADDLGVPWSLDEPPVDLASHEPDDSSFRVDDCGELNLMWISGCTSWTLEQGCVDWMLCAVYDCSNDNYDHYVCFINW